MANTTWISFNLHVFFSWTAWLFVCGPTLTEYLTICFSVCASVVQVMESVTVGSVNAMLVTLATTATARRKHRAAFQMMGRCAVAEEAVCAAAVSALSQEPSEIPVKNAPPALMPVAQRGRLCCTSHVWHSPSQTFRKGKADFSWFVNNMVKNRNKMLTLAFRIAASVNPGKGQTSLNSYITPSLRDLWENTFCAPSSKQTLMPFVT